MQGIRHAHNGRNLGLMSTIGQNQIAYKRKVGTLDGKAVYEVGLIGGLCLISVQGVKAPLGAGPHRAVAKHIASRRHPEIHWTALSKSDSVSIAHFEDLLPKYEAFTDALVEAAS